METGALRVDMERNGFRSNADRREKFFDHALVIAFFVALIALLAAGCGDDEKVAGTPDGPAWTGDPLTQTRSGPVMGVEGKGETWVWKAIPFAKPPVGALRWKAPRDPDPWTDAREESEYCKPCAQYFFVGTLTYGSEDCLYLNVWRPRTSETNLPVYFWIHGGGNTLGTASSDDYNGANLADRSNLVVVTVNYRVGPFGWFTHPALREGAPGSELDDSGNYGTLDLVKALHWVRDNIEDFGGDPERVMIAGESAGAFNVLSLLVSPLAEGLFHRAMSESGGPMSSSVWAAEMAGSRDAMATTATRNTKVARNLPAAIWVLLSGRVRSSSSVRRVRSSQNMPLVIRGMTARSTRAVSVTVGRRTCSNRLSPGGIIPAPIWLKAVRVCRSMICVLKAFRLSRKNRLIERAMAVKAM